MRPEAWKPSPAGASMSHACARRPQPGSRRPGPERTHVAHVVAEARVGGVRSAPAAAQSRVGLARRSGEHGRSVSERGRDPRPGNVSGTEIASGRSSAPPRAAAVTLPCGRRPAPPRGPRDGPGCGALPTLQAWPRARRPPRWCRRGNGPLAAQCVCVFRAGCPAGDDTRPECAAPGGEVCGRDADCGRAHVAGVGAASCLRLALQRSAPSSGLCCKV